MTSSRPYLIRALYEWLNDNYLTACILVDTEMEEVFVPKEYINEGKIVLNISPDAVRDLRIANTELEFYAAFSGRSRHISMPIGAIMAIYAQENGSGMVFGDEPGGDTPPDKASKPSQEKPASKKPHLKIVKDTDGSSGY